MNNQTVLYSMCVIGLRTHFYGSVVSLLQNLLITSIYHMDGAIIMQVYEESKTTASLTLSDWTKKFWGWLFQLSEEANPVTVVGPSSPWR